MAALERSDLAPRQSRNEVLVEEAPRTDHPEAGDVHVGATQTVDPVEVDEAVVVDLADQLRGRVFPEPVGRSRESRVVGVLVEGVEAVMRAVGLDDTTNVRVLPVLPHPQPIPWPEAVEQARQGQGEVVGPTMDEHQHVRPRSGLSVHDTHGFTGSPSSYTLPLHSRPGPASTRSGPWLQLSRIQTLSTTRTSRGGPCSSDFSVR